MSAAATATKIHPSPDAPFAPAQVALLCNAVNSSSLAVRRNRSDIRGMENMAATAEAAEMAAEGAAIVEAEAVRITAGEAVSRRKVARIPNPAIRPLPPNATSV